MFGNCATGKLTIVIAPTITVRMAITIATIDRLMKKLELDLDSFQSNYENSPLAPFGEGGLAVPVFAGNSLVTSGLPSQLAFIRTQMAWAAPSCPGGEA